MEKILIALVAFVFGVLITVLVSLFYFALHYYFKLDLVACFVGYMLFRESSIYYYELLNEKEDKNV